MSEKIPCAVNSNREIRVHWAIGNVGLELLRDLSEEPPGTGRCAYGGAFSWHLLYILSLWW